MSQSTQRLHAIVYGIVQGVNFRYYTTLRAQALDLTGWVRNRPDGAVEVSAEGSRAALEQLLAFLREGPGQAHVDRVDAEWVKSTGQFTRFQVLR